MLKVGDIVKWEGNFFSHFKKGKTRKDVDDNICNPDFNLEDYIVRKYQSGINVVQSFYYDDILKIRFISLDNGKEFREGGNHLTKVSLDEIINYIYQKFCDETERTGGVLVHSSIGEWHEYLAHSLKVLGMAA